MSSTAIRGAVLVVISALLGAAILAWGADTSAFDSTVVVADGAETTTAATTTPVPETITDTPTVVAEETTPTTPTTTVQSDPRSPSEVRVQVANAARIKGLAGEFTSRLAARGYITGDATNFEAQASSVIYYEPGYEADAAAILAVFNSPDTLAQPMPDPRPAVDSPDPFGVNILIIVGGDSLSTS